MATIDYDSFFTAQAKRRQPSAIRVLYPFLKIPNMISLGGGMPNSALFPISKLQISVGHVADGATSTAPREVTIEGKELEASLQYNNTAGQLELLERWQRVQKAEHSPKVPFSCIFTNGSQAGLAQAFDCLIDEHTTLLVESPTYSGALCALDATGCKYACVPTDGQGLIPSAIDDMLDRWEEDHPGAASSAPAASGPSDHHHNSTSASSGSHALPLAKPRILYCIPTGANPTGASLPLERRVELLKVARKHNLIILEDDPYHYLQFAPVDLQEAPDAGAENGAAAAADDAGKQAVTHTRIPSLWSLDEDGRVLRFDSLSKVIAAGLRIGIVTGPEPLVNKILLHTQATSIHVSGISQAVVLSLFRQWRVGGTEHATSALPASSSSSSEAAAAAASSSASKAVLGDLEIQVQRVSCFYRSQCRAFLLAARRHLTENEDGSGAPLVQYSPPVAGMFVWMKLLDIADTWRFCMGAAKDAGVLMVPGAAFFPGGPAKDKPDQKQWVRCSFSTASHAQIEEALRRLGGVLREARTSKASAVAAGQ